MSSVVKLLLVEDDRSVAGALNYTLRSSFDMDIAGNGKMAISLCKDNKYDIIVLDLNLPDLPGLSVCEQLRQKGLDTPILILSAETHVLTKINLLDAGANDYLTKPFSLGELKVRVRVLVRDHKKDVWPQPKLNVSQVELDRSTYTVKRNNQLIHLRRKEFAILECLMEQAGSVVTRNNLMQTVWSGNDELWTNTLDVHIKYLRDKVDRPFERQLITTIHGRGYKFESIDQKLNLVTPS
jgi:two-component system OmpR family response regulator